MRGLAVLLPSILTLWILWYAFVFVFNNVAAPINSWIRGGVLLLIPATLDEPYRPDWYTVTAEQVQKYRRDTTGAASAATISDSAVTAQIRRENFRQYWEARWHLKAVGLLVAIVSIYLAGRFLGGFVGRRIYGRIENVLAQIPVVRQVYPHVKQLVELVLGDTPMAFNRVVLVEFPRPGTWVIAFVTGQSTKMIADGVGRECLTVFVPNTPTPFTGFTLTVPVSDVIDIPISIDEAVRYVITGGVLVPENKGARAAGGTLPDPVAPGAVGGNAAR